MTIEPADARTAGAQWRVDGGAWQNSGDTVNNLPVGSHTVSFKLVANWDTPSNQTVTILRDQLIALSARYNPFVTQWIMKKKPTKTMILTPKKGTLEPNLDEYFGQGYELSVWDGTQLIHGPYALVQKKPGAPIWSYKDGITKINYKQKNGMHIMMMAIQAALPDTITLRLTPPASLATAPVNIMLEPEDVERSARVIPLRATVRKEPAAGGNVTE